MRCGVVRYGARSVSAPLPPGQAWRTRGRGGFAGSSLLARVQYFGTRRGGAARTCFSFTTQGKRPALSSRRTEHTGWLGALCGHARVHTTSLPCASYLRHGRRSSTNIRNYQHLMLQPLAPRHFETPCDRSTAELLPTSCQLTSCIPEMPPAGCCLQALEGVHISGSAAKTECCRRCLTDAATPSAFCEPSAEQCLLLHSEFVLHRSVLQLKR
jgi:hypothetical protein